MTDARFLQIHSLSGHSAVLLNRDDAGLAKRLPYGDAIRTRISSQCLKRRWRTDTGVHSLLGEPEITYLAGEARALAEAHSSDPGAAKAAANAWAATAHANIRAMRESCALPGGLAAALFGRMVTSDVEANIDAAVHVAHAFTVHAEEREPAADHIGETELTSGLFYGYVVVGGGPRTAGPRALSGAQAVFAHGSPLRRLGSRARRPVRAVRDPACRGSRAAGRLAGVGGR